MGQLFTLKNLLGYSTLSNLAVSLERPTRQAHPAVRIIAPRYNVAQKQDPFQHAVLDTELSLGMSANMYVIQMATVGDLKVLVRGEFQSSSMKLFIMNPSCMTTTHIKMMTLNANGGTATMEKARASVPVDGQIKIEFGEGTIKTGGEFILRVGNF